MKVPGLSVCVVRVLVVLGFLALAGCVTTTDSPFAREANKQKAEENYVKLGMAYIGQGNYDRARDHLERALQINPDSPSALAGMGLIYQTEGEPDLAEKSFLNALDSDSNYTRGRVFYGAFLYNQGRYKDAETQFTRASKDTEYDDRGSVFYNLGRTQDELGDFEDATASYKRAVGLSRGNANYLLALSTSLVNEGDYASAEHYYNQLVGMMQHNPNLKHSPESLLTGLRLAHHFGDENREASLALLLRKQYPKSEQLKQYRALISND